MITAAFFFMRYTIVIVEPSPGFSVIATYLGLNDLKLLQHPSLQVSDAAWISIMCDGD